MAARDIKFSEFMPEVVDVLVKALLYVMASGKSGYMMFGTYNVHDMPTDAENMHANEIIQATIQSQTIFYGSEQFVAYALKSVADEIESSDYTVTGEHCFKDGMPTGIALSAEQLVKLKGLARILCPQAEISSSKKLPAQSDLSNALLKSCLKMLEKAASEVPPEIDYGQHNIGIVVDGVLFDFPKNHEVISGLRHILDEITDR